MSLKRKLVDLLDYAYRQEQVFIQTLSDEERSVAGTLEQWSAKDIIAHIAAWKGRAAQVLAAVGSGEPGPSLDGLDEFNARIIQEHQNLTWKDVMDKSRQAYRLLREETETTPEDVLTAPEPAERNAEPVWWFVVGNGCTHPLSHLTEFYIAHGKTTIAIEMQEDAAGLLLQLDGPDWKVYYGLASHYAAAGQPEKAVDALSKAFDLNPSLVKQAKEDPRFALIREHPR